MKIFFVILILTLGLVNLYSERYMENIHKYIFEEGVKLLEHYKVYSQYQFEDGQNPRYNRMYEGSFEEDISDWVYGYDLWPDIDIEGIDGLPELIAEYFLASITHFWDADDFLPYLSSYFKNDILVGMIMIMLSSYRMRIFIHIQNQNSVNFLNGRD